MTTARFRRFWLLLGMLLPFCGFAADAGKDTLYHRQIVLEAGAGTLVTAASADLITYLGRMTGQPFVIAREPAAALASGIYLLNANSSLVAAKDRDRLKDKGLEAFVIRGDANRMLIIANDMRGLSHGVCFYLEQLGVRWLLPGANWTVVPTRADVTLKIDRLVAPAFWSREWAGTGGYYSVLFGRQFTGAADRNKGIVDSEIDEETWERRMRIGGQPLGHAMGEAFISDRTITPILAAHPEYLAKIDGKYSPLYIPAKDGDFVLDAATGQYVKAKPGLGTHELNTIAKLNAGNPEVVKLFADWILNNYRAVRNTPGGYWLRTVSVEPADGGGEGNNYDELKAQGVGDGSESDQEFFIANECARRVRMEFPDTSVVMLAYAGRSDPPTFKLEPNFIVQPALAMRGGRKTADLNLDEWLDLWSKKADNMALYTYWSIPDWDHDEPTFNYLDVARQLRAWHAKNIKGLNAESTWSAGAMGLGQYVAAHVMWDPTLDDRALIDDWYTQAFGPAKAPMKRMLERWATGYRPIAVELGASYRDIAEAERLATGNAAMTARVDDFARYLHYLRLRDEFLNIADTTARGRKASALAEYIFDIHDSRMLHTTRDFDLLAFRGYPALKEEFYLHGAGTLPGDPPDGPGWARVHPLSHDEVAALITDGLEAYLAPDFALKRYTGLLTPLAPLKWTAPTTDPWGPEVTAVADVTVDLQVLPGMTIFPLRVSRAANNVVTIVDAAGHTVFHHAVTALDGTSAEKWKARDEMNVPLKPGHYTVHFNPSGGRAAGYFNFTTWKGVPLILSKYISPKGFGSPKLYFYVPRGLHKIAFYFPLTSHAGGFETPVYQPDGAQAQVEHRDGGKVLVVTVPAGMDGKIWWLDRFIQPDELMETLNIPQAFSLEPGTLMVPAEALR